MAPPPTLVLSTAIGTPNDFIPIYLRKHYKRNFGGMLAVLLSLAFEAWFPFEVAQLIKIVNQRTNEYITQEKFDDEMNKIYAITIVVALITLVAEWTASDLNRVMALGISKQLRYDLFFNFFERCPKLHQEVDKDKSL